MRCLAPPGAPAHRGRCHGAPLRAAAAPCPASVAPASAAAAAAWRPAASLGRPLRAPRCAPARSRARPCGSWRGSRASRAARSRGWVACSMRRIALHALTRRALAGDAHSAAVTAWSAPAGRRSRPPPAARATSRRCAVRSAAPAPRASAGALAFPPAALRCAHAPATARRHRHCAREGHGHRAARRRRRGRERRRQQLARSLCALTRRVLSLASPALSCARVRACAHACALRRWRKSGEDTGAGGYRCRWTVMGGAAKDGSWEYKETARCALCCARSAACAHARCACARAALRCVRAARLLLRSRALACPNAHALALCSRARAAPPCL
jgi:hypothetical protein